MSWSVNLIGTPDKIAAALDEYSGNLTDFSKEEFDGALPSLKQLLEQNKSDQPGRPVLLLSAHGHGHKYNGQVQYQTCSVKLEDTGSALLY